MLKRLSYLVLMLYFLGVATGGVNAFLQKQKDKFAALTDEEDENLVRNNFSLEEDVICHEVYWDSIGFVSYRTPNTLFATSSLPDVPLSLVAPPPELA